MRYVIGPRSPCGNSVARRLLAEAGMVLDTAYPVRHTERLHEMVRAKIAEGGKFIIFGRRVDLDQTRRGSAAHE
jgi:hypothetical protein